jgi:hypothetical protein
MNNKKLAWFLLVCSVLLLSLNIYRVSTGSENNYFGIISNLLLIIAMLVSIYQKKNKE